MALDKPKSIDTLTSFRFFAALGVFLHHLQDFRTGQRHHFFPQGHMGVAFFFVLSGFILSYNYADTFKELNWKTISKFLIARFARIYPLHILTFCLSIPIKLAENWFYSLVNCTVIGGLNLLLLQSWFPSENIYSSFNRVSWTISDEAFFYALFPIAAFVLVRVCRKPWQWILAGLSVIVVHLAWRLAAPGILPDSMMDWALNRFPVFRFLDFLLGMIAFYLLRGSRLFSGSKTTQTLLECLAIAGVVLALCLEGSTSNPLAVFLIVLSCAFLIAVFSKTGGLISQLLSNRLLVYLGEISYGIYMFHVLILLAAEHSGLFSGWHPLVTGSLFLFVTILASAWSHEYFERPLRRWIVSKA